MGISQATQCESWMWPLSAQNKQLQPHTNTKQMLHKRASPRRRLHLPCSELSPLGVGGQGEREKEKEGGFRLPCYQAWHSPRQLINPSSQLRISLLLPAPLQSGFSLPQTSQINIQRVLVPCLRIHSQLEVKGPCSPLTPM